MPDAPPPVGPSGATAQWDAPGPDLWQALGWQPNALQLEQLQQLQVELRQWNSRLNLTRLVEGADFWIAQVFDSLWPLLPRLQGGQAEAPLRCIDVGTGGGFPGLAAAIALPLAQGLVGGAAHHIKGEQLNQPAHACASGLQWISRSTVFHGASWL